MSQGTLVNPETILNEYKQKLLSTDFRRTFCSVIGKILSSIVGLRCTTFSKEKERYYKQPYSSPTTTSKIIYCTFRDSPTIIRIEYQAKPQVYIDINKDLLYFRYVAAAHVINSDGESIASDTYDLSQEFELSGIETSVDNFIKKGYQLRLDEVSRDLRGFIGVFTHYKGKPQ